MVHRAYTIHYNIFISYLFIGMWFFMGWDYCKYHIYNIFWCNLRKNS